MMNDVDQTGWCTILSDPGVFTELLAGIGVRGVQVEEFYALDRDLFASFGKVHGLVFLFRYRQNEQASASLRSGTLLDPPPSNIFFARQMTNNACATQAILSIVMNSREIDVGPELTNFKEFTSGFDSASKGLAISNSETIRATHNSFSAHQQFVLEHSPLQNDEEEVPYHFVSYVPVDGKVYELDGLQDGPREHGEYDSNGQDWLDVVFPVLASRMAEYSNEGEIRFTLMGVVNDIREKLEAEMAPLPESSDEKRIVREHLAMEMAKRERWKRENARRRFNFIPFIVETLKAMAETGQLTHAIEAASSKKLRRSNESSGMGNMQQSKQTTKRE